MTGKGGKMYERCSILKNVETRTSGGTSPVDSLVSLRWSPERPSESGWYFVRIKGDQLDVEIVLVKGDSPTCPKYVLEHGKKDRYMLDRYTDECEWYGPLAVPEAK
jgi:hypothetical protein